MSENWTAVAVAIKERMAALRITQMELANRSGVSPATIRELQNNRSPRRRYGRTLAALSEALEWSPVHLDDLLNDREPTAPDEAPKDAVLDELRAIRRDLSLISARLDRIEGNDSPEHE